MDSEAFNYILKQYLKGKKDNINFILLQLRDFILEKYKKYNLTSDEMKVLIKFLVHGIDTYSFEKSISFISYLDIYMDIALSTYKKADKIDDFELPTDDFFELLLNNLKEISKNEKQKRFNLNEIL